MFVPGDTALLPAGDMAPTPGFFNKQISVKLDDTNYLLWRQQVLLLVRGQGLEHFLNDTFPPPTPIVTNTDGTPSVNPAYQRFLKQDSSLTSWLLSTVSTTILPHLVGAESSSSICAFTTQVKEVRDLLAICGNPISELEQVATVLNDLPTEFESVVAVISANKEPYTFDGAVSLLIDAETRLEDPLRFSVGIHNTTVESQQAPNDPRSIYPYGGRGGFRGGRSGPGGRFKGRPRYQCQICGKLGHLADRCWHRFDHTYQSPTKSTTEVHACCWDSPEPSYNPFVTSDPSTVEVAPTAPPQINSLVVVSTT